MRHPGRRRARGYGGGHRGGAGGDPRTRCQERQRHPQEDPDPARADLRAAEPARSVRTAQVRIGRPVSGRPVLALQVPPLPGRAAGVRSRARYRRLRRRPGQLPVSALVPGHVGAARLHGRRQARRDAGVPAHPARGAAGRRSGIRLRAPGDDRSPAQRRGARDAQKRRPAALAAARRGAARPLHRVRQDRRRGEPHRRGPAEQPRERHQGAAQAARCAAR